MRAYARAAALPRKVVYRSAQTISSMTYEGKPVELLSESDLYTVKYDNKEGRPFTHVGTVKDNHDMFLRNNGFSYKTDA